MEIIVIVLLMVMFVIIILAASVENSARADPVTNIHRIGHTTRQEINRVCDEDLKEQLDYLTSAHVMPMQNGNQEDNCGQET